MRTTQFPNRVQLCVFNSITWTQPVPAIFPGSVTWKCPGGVTKSVPLVSQLCFQLCFCGVPAVAALVVFVAVRWCSGGVLVVFVAVFWWRACCPGCVGGFPAVSCLWFRLCFGGLPVVFRLCFGGSRWYSSVVLMSWKDASRTASKLQKRVAPNIAHLCQMFFSCYIGTHSHPDTRRSA